MNNGIWIIIRMCIESDLAPVHHYAVFGEAEGRSPNPLFDAQWYVGQYPDVAQQQASPFLHFCRYGADRTPQPQSLVR